MESSATETPSARQQHDREFQSFRKTHPELSQSADRESSDSSIYVPREAQRVADGSKRLQAIKQHGADDISRLMNEQNLMRVEKDLSDINASMLSNETRQLLALVTERISERPAVDAAILSQVHRVQSKYLELAALK